MKKTQITKEYIAETRKIFGVHLEKAQEIEMLRARILELEAAQNKKGTVPPDHDTMCRDLSQAIWRGERALPRFDPRMDGVDFDILEAWIVERGWIIRWTVEAVAAWCGLNRSLTDDEPEHVGCVYFNEESSFTRRRRRALVVAAWKALTGWKERESRDPDAALMEVRYDA